MFLRVARLCIDMKFHAYMHMHVNVYIYKALAMLLDSLWAPTGIMPNEMSWLL